MWQHELQDDALDVAAESGQQRAVRFRELEAECLAKAESYRRQAEACEKGCEGERLVAGLLDTLDGAGWIVLHDRYKSAGSRANLDHVVVGPQGVTVIDAKNWSSGPLGLDERGMRLGRWRKDDDLRAGADAARAVREQVLSTEPDVPVQTLLAFTQDMGLERPVEHRGVVLLQAEQLLRWLTDQPRVLSQQQVHRLASDIDAALPPRTGPRRPVSATDTSGGAHPAPPAGGLPAQSSTRTRTKAAPAPRSNHGRRPERLAVPLAALLLLVLWLAPAVAGRLT